MKSAFLFSTALAVIGFSFMNQSRAADQSDPEVIPTVDLSRYAGQWFEIAHDKNFYQRKCVRSTADYSVISEGALSVHNRCTHKNGRTQDIRGIARVVNPEVIAKLKVKFSFFQRGDYWIVDLDPDYQWAVVSGPKKKSLFILARSAPMDEKLLAEILERLKSRGFSLDDLVYDDY